MSHRRTLPVVPFWAMLCAVWAMLLLGAAPASLADDAGAGIAQAEIPCGAAGHHAPGHPRQGCPGCCACTLSGALQALAAAPPRLPAPRDGVLAAAAVSTGAAPVLPPSPVARARSPPPSA